MDPTVSSSTGSLKISLKLKNAPPPPPRRTCPFYLMKDSLPPEHPLLGSKNLINAADLGGAHQKYCTSGKLKTDLASFLPQLCNTRDLCSTISASTNLRSLIEKPPITGKAIMPPNDLKGFMLTPGTVHEGYRLFDTKDVSRLLGTNAPTMASPEDDTKNYDEFGNNYGDTESEKRAHRMKLKRTLDDNDGDGGEKKKKHVYDESEGGERRKKHKKEKKKSKKEKKKDKERKDVDTDDNNSRPSFSSFH